MADRLVTVTSAYAGSLILPPERPGRRQFGVPPGGPFDSELAAIAKSIASAHYLIEITTPIVITVRSPVRLGLASPVGSALLTDRESLDVGALDFRSPGSLSLRAPQKGGRAYLSIPSLGWSKRDPELVPIHKSLETQSADVDFLRFAFPLSHRPRQLRLCNSVVTNEVQGQVGRKSSRVGIRIDDLYPALEQEPRPLRRSEPAIFGAVQATPGGELLIHGPDGPTLGGYPHVGTVCRADLPILAQLKPEETLTLQPISHAEALKALHQRKVEMDKFLAEVRSIFSLRPFQP